MKNVKRKFICLTVAAIAAAASTGCSSSQGAETYQQQEASGATEQESRQETLEATEQESQQGTTEATEQESQQDSTESETSAVEDKMDEVEPLTAAFEKNGYVINMEVGGTYDFVTVCHDDPSKELVGSLTISEYETVEENLTYALEKKEGYEWHILHAVAQFTDGNPFVGGTGFACLYEDYYDIDGWDSSCQDKNVIPMENYADRTYTVNYQGTDYECDMICYHNIETDPTSCTIDFYFYASIPTGYDGTVVVFGKRQPDIENPTIYDIADEDTLYFRMN